jgi:hypothetical protein
MSAVGPCPRWFQRQRFMFAMWQAWRTHASASVLDSGCHNQQSDGWRLPFPLDLAIWPFRGRAIALVAAPSPLHQPFFQPFVCGRALKQAFVGYPLKIPVARHDQGVESVIHRVHTCYVATAPIAVAEIQ